MMLNGTEPAEFDCLDMLNSTMLEVVNQFGRIPVLEESVTSHFFCSCENRQKSVKIIERNWCLMVKAPYQSLGAISGNFE